jgi:hypothetical protein
MAAERALAAVVQEPAPDGAAPPAPAGAAAWTVFDDPGPAATRRWLVAESPAGVAPAALLGAVRAAAGAPAAVSFTARPLGERRSPAFRVPRVSHVMPIAIAAPAGDVGEIDRWYEQEHAELLLRCPDWLRVRRYAIETIDGAAWSRLALHDLSSADVMSTPEVRAAIATPWRRRLAERPWFLGEAREPFALRTPPAPA